MLMSFFVGVGLSIKLYDHTSASWYDSAFLGMAVVAAFFALTRRHGVDELDGGLALGVVLSVVVVWLFKYHDGIALGLADQVYRHLTVILSTVIAYRMGRQWDRPN